MIGRDIIASIIDTGDLRPYLKAGLTLSWMDDKDDHSSWAIFGERDSQEQYAYRYILGYFDSFRKAPPRRIFDLDCPGFELGGTDAEPPELIDKALDEIRYYYGEQALADISEMNQDGRHQDIAAYMETVARRLRAFRSDSNISLVWDAQIDVDARLAQRVPSGFKFGIPALDNRYRGAQPGQLITLLGRAKAGKTTFLLLAAHRAWETGHRVMFVTVEIAAEVIRDKLDCMHAHISHSRLSDGHLKPEEEERYRRARKEMEEYEDAFVIVQPRAGSYDISSLADDIEQHQPDVVFVDGFYFLIDRHTRRSGGHWEGHDNLAREMKELAMDLGVSIWTTMQLREKQLKGKGTDDGAMMGGTGLIMASDLVIAPEFDRETGLHTIVNTRSRYEYLPEVRGRWDWDHTRFVEEDNGEAAFISTSGREDDAAQDRAGGHTLMSRRPRALPSASGE